MAIGSTNYAQPVHVNGFICRNCTDVDNAKKHIDPAHPKSGPYGIDAATDPANPKAFLQSSSPPGSQASGAETDLRSTGRLIDIQA
jgi:hypothetical protein